MKILGLDISTKTGCAVFNDGQLVSYCVIEKTFPSIANDYGDYPWSFLHVANDIVHQIVDKINLEKPDIVVIEEINKPGRFGSRHSQRLLDSLHFLLIQKIEPHHEAGKLKVCYINTSDWRKKLNLSVAETKKMARPYIKELDRLKKEFAKADKTNKKSLKIQLDTLKKDLKSKCIHGKVDKKSISVAHVNLKYGLNLNKGQNDISDAVCQVEAYIKGVKVITNKDIFDNKKKRGTE